MSVTDGCVGEIDPPAQSLLKRFLDRPGLRRILSNTGWLAGDRIIRLGVGLFVTSWIARYLGPAQFGLLNYAVAFVYLFSILGALGLDTVVIRSLIQEPEARDRLLCTTFFVKLAGGTLSFLLSLATLYYIHADRTTTTLIVIIGFGTIIQATDTIDLWFQSQVKSKWSVLSKNTAFFAVALFKIALLSLHAGIIWLAVASLLEITIGAAGLVFNMLRLGEAPLVWKPDLKLARHLLAQSWPLFLSGVSVMVYMRIDQIMLERMAGEGAVGLYSAAVRVSEIFYFVPTAIASSILPSIVRARSLSREVYLGRIQKYFDLSAIMAIGIALPTTFIAPFITRLLYGAQYNGVSSILTVHIWATLFVFMGVARGQYLLSEGRFVFIMAATAAGAICNILLNLLWIPRYGAFGSAIATVVSYGVSDFVSSFCYRETFHVGIMQIEAIFLPLSVRRMLGNREAQGGKG
jgi:PST family polysaccharide transporter